MINHTLAAASAAVLVCLTALPAQAATLISATDPEAILEIAKGYGSAELSKDSEGDPKIVGRIKGAKYGILFYGCSNGKECDDIQFTAAWGGIKVSQSAINEWNKERRYGKAYLDDENDPTLEMVVNLKHGVTRDNFDDTFDWWGVALNGFKSEVLKE